MRKGVEVKGVDKAEVVFNKKYEMFDGKIGRVVVSRAKTVRAVVRTLMKVYHVATFKTDAASRPDVTKAKREFSNLVHG